MNIPRPEHPNPQSVRERWENLNGEWSFAVDWSKSGRARDLKLGEAGYDKKIIVPFCPESELSGVGIKDFMPAVWYARKIEISATDLTGKVLLNIGACDWFCEVFVNGESCGTHRGGYSSFRLDITAKLKEGENTLVILAEDDTRSGLQATGKQSTWFASHGCFYTRTTGIWQTVWLEFVPRDYIKSFYVTADTENSIAVVNGTTCGCGKISAVAYYEGKEVGSATAYACGSFSIALPLSELHLWEIGCGRLYDLKLTFNDDTVTSYFGMRTVGFDGMKFMLNGKSVFQRLVLDQGFYPDGIYTAATEDALIKDIQISLDCGFNGARLHEKAFEPRFLYHADKMGYLVWGEYGNWGLDHSNPAVTDNVVPEWLELIERDRSHPALIGWCPFNETWDYEGNKRQRNALLATVYKVTKAVDPTRPCIDTSGNFHVITDIFDVHNYEQDPKIFKETYLPLETEGVLTDRHSKRQTYRGEPVFMSEYGGIGLTEGCDDEYGATANHTTTWSYGKAATCIAEYIDRYRALTDAMLDNSAMHGFCYTQLYDVEQEQNGIYTYDRRPKLDVSIIKEINTRKAAIED